MHTSFPLLAMINLLKKKCIYSTNTIVKHWLKVFTAAIYYLYSLTSDFLLRYVNWQIWTSRMGVKMIENWYVFIFTDVSFYLSIDELFSAINWLTLATRERLVLTYVRVESSFRSSWLFIINFIIVWIINSNFCSFMFKHFKSCTKKKCLCAI